MFIILLIVKKIVRMIVIIYETIAKRLNSSYPHNNIEKTHSIKGKPYANRKITIIPEDENLSHPFFSSS